MKTTKILFALLAVLSLGISGCDNDDDTATPVVPEKITLRAVGVATGTPIETTIEGVGIDVAGNAFTMDFYDEATGQRLGTVVDINVAAETFEDGSMKAENYTVFTFEEDNSTLVLHNFIDMTPIDEVTLKGVIQPGKAQYNVIGGTGRFADASGGSTLDAILDMAEFANGTIGFDCVYGVSFKE